MKVLYVAAEISPFARITNTADLMRFLPASLQDKGFEIRILLPKYGSIHDRRNRLHEVIRLSGIQVKVGENVESMKIKVASIPNAKLQVYFLDNDTYYQRKGYFKDLKNEKSFPDNDQRLVFYNKGVLETVKKLGWKPDIVHCHNWQAGLVPMLLKTVYKNDEIFSNTKVVYNLHNASNDETFDQKIFDHIGMPDDFDSSSVAPNGEVDLVRAGLTYADHVVTGNELRDEFNELFSELNIEPTAIQGAPQDVSSKFADYYRSISEE